MKGDKSKEKCNERWEEKMEREDGKERLETTDDSNIGDGFWNGESMTIEFEAEKFVGNGVVIDSVVC